MNRGEETRRDVRGAFTDIDGERYYAIENVDRMPPFFISVVSSDDHWLFVSSNGGVTAGRVSPATALFPYITVDKIHDSVPHTGCKTLLRVRAGGESYAWEPFNSEQYGRYALARHIYKNVLGNKLRFEEINHDLGLAFRYTWLMSDEYGFVRYSELENLGKHDMHVDLVDGLQNILPAGTPLFTQTNVSNLVDAYKWTELDSTTGLAFFTLYSGITDRAEPCESLKATTVFSLGLDDRRILLSSEQLERFRHGGVLEQEDHRRGIRGAYLIDASFELARGTSRDWQIVANTEQTQSEAVALRQRLREGSGVGEAIERSVDLGSDRLARIIAGADGFQAVAEENVAVHHYANVLFNVLRGGIFDDQYNVSSRDLSRTIRLFNKNVYRRNRELLEQLPETIRFAELIRTVIASGDLQLLRLCEEYLPITFGRRHGDPSRPWNQFTIRLKDDYGNRLLSYEGNWRDIFQNWEALALSYPEFIENVIAKFVNASTMDGYNPYRITKEGIDWEVEEPDNPWSYIGYWGDHQIIYLQKLLELSSHFHPTRLRNLLRRPVFCYANVPYRIRPLQALLDNPKATVDYDEVLARRIDERVADIGADGKLVLDGDGEVYQVNLFEKLLVPLLGKLGNLVVDGGIWLNTQRPEWNDANNALVGNGLSMVTLYYMRRYVRFLQDLLSDESDTFALSREVADWLQLTAGAMATTRGLLGSGPVSESDRLQSLLALGKGADRYRQTVYRQDGFSGTVEQPVAAVTALLDDALAAIDHSIAVNRRDDGLYHAYNLMDYRGDGVGLETLYPMLEGQVAALSAGAISPDEAVAVLEALFESDVYRADQDSFMLYPDRELPDFLDKNRIDPRQVAGVPLLERMLAQGDERIVVRDTEGNYRFSAEFRNVGDLEAELAAVAPDYGEDLDAARIALKKLFEDVFDHKSFTGRSGTMFGFEGLGSIYWHMVSKLLLAAEENFFAAIDQGADPATCRSLAALYYRIRRGIGFNKTPRQYGAFPTDPYSHTPGHAGAQQPGMTGQVKEEILTRFGELGVRVHDGCAHFQPALLRAREFDSKERPFRYVDVDDQWQEIRVPASGLAFTWCQVPIVYELTGESEPMLAIADSDGGETVRQELVLTADESAELFDRSGHIRKLHLRFGAAMLLAD